MSPSRFTPETRTGPVTGSLKIEVRTRLPLQVTSRGMPTLTEMTRASLLLVMGVPLIRNVVRVVSVPVEAQPLARFNPDA